MRMRNLIFAVVTSGHVINGKVLGKKQYYL